MGAGFGGALKAEAALGGGFGVVGVGGLGDGHGHVVVWFFGERGCCGWWGDCFRHALWLFGCSKCGGGIDIASSVWLRSLLRACGLVANGRA